VRFIRAYATNVMRLEADGFDGNPGSPPACAKSHYEDEMEEAFPQDPKVQLAEVLKSMARAWEGTSARLLRQAKGAPADAGLGLVVQRMARGPGKGLSGAGVIAVRQLRHRRGAGHGPLSAAGAGPRGAVAVRGHVHRNRSPGSRP
jgi:pyruvate,orthophosphate dikinase